MEKLETKDIDGRTPLMMASNEGHIETVRELIEAGADMDVRGSNTGWTVLMVTSLNGHIEIVRVLTDKLKAK